MRSAAVAGPNLRAAFELVVGQNLAAGQAVDAMGIQVSDQPAEASGIVRKLFFKVFERVLAVSG